jgi:hypothetical protein
MFTFFFIISLIVFSVSYIAAIYTFISQKNQIKNIFLSLEDMDISVGGKHRFFSIYRTAEGTINGHYISVRIIYENRSRFFQIKAVPGKTIPHGCYIIPHGVISFLVDKISQQDIKTGDLDFDERLNVGGHDSAGIVSLLNAKARATIMSLLAWHVEKLTISEDKIIFLIPLHSVGRDGKVLKERIGNLVELCTALSTEKDIKKGLIDNALSDPDRKVRANNLNLLLQNYPVDSEVKEALRKIIKDRDINIQITAARYLGEEGAGVLKMIIEKEPDNYKSKAIIALAHSQGVKSLPDLISVYNLLHSYNTGSNVKQAFASAFEYIGDNRAQDLLLDMLHSDDNSIRKAAVKALGTCGDKKAVVMLYHLRKASRLNASLKVLFRASIARIQSRLGYTEKGWLSLSIETEEAGALSLEPDDKSGDLSIIEEGDKP